MTAVECHKCIFSKRVPGDTHLECINPHAQIEAHEHGVKSGWVMWPMNFDPNWLISCTGYMDQIVKETTQEAFLKLICVLENDDTLKDLKTDKEKIDAINDHIKTIAEHENVHHQHIRNVYNVAVNKFNA